MVTLAQLEAESVYTPQRQKRRHSFLGADCPLRGHPWALALWGASGYLKPGSSPCFMSWGAGLWLLTLTIRHLHGEPFWIQPHSHKQVLKETHYLGWLLPLNISDITSTVCCSVTFNNGCCCGFPVVFSFAICCFFSRWSNIFSVSFLWLSSTACLFQLFSFPTVPTVLAHAGHLVFFFFFCLLCIILGCLPWGNCFLFFWCYINNK